MTQKSNGLGTSFAYLLQQNQIKNLKVTPDKLSDQNTSHIKNKSDNH